VLKIAADFLKTKSTLQKIVRDGYPFILVDESQDTNRHIVDALFELQRLNKDRIGVGLLGDMMQRIYGDGAPTLGLQLPPDWATPTKKLNFRCPKRVVTLINKVREATDQQMQVPKSTAAEGYTRMFIFPTDADKAFSENLVCEEMSKVSGDEKWSGDDVKVLILEHHMAARRMGFERIFNALQSVPRFRTALLDGSLPILSFFSDVVLPLYDARENKFKTAQIIRNASVLLSAETLRESTDQAKQLAVTQDAVDSLVTLLDAGNAPTLRDVAQKIHDSGLFSLPERIKVALNRGQAAATNEISQEDVDEDKRTGADQAVDDFLSAPFSEIQPYSRYVKGKARFDTHQGVKGLEFPRVMVIMDDKETRGFQFKYEKLFGPGSEDDAILAATRRLFYVTCSRAEQSLALVAYSSNPNRVRDHVIAQGWFAPDEVHS
jgi:DNA helicase-2/ATP-dependent DNA helicase PcrA